MAFRAFVGVPVGSAPDLVRLLDGLEESGADVRTVHPEQLHLTLSFLGDVPDDSAPTLAEALDAATHGTRPFEMRLHQVGAFPNARRPRVVWVGVAEPEPMVDLATRVRESLAAAGFPGDDKDFRAHVTLARTRSERNLDKLVAFLREHGRDSFGSLAVSEVRLYRSTLGPQGAAHEVLHRASLGV